MLKVDVLQVFINTSAIIGIGLLWFNFNEKVFKTVRRLAAAPLYWPKKEADIIRATPVMRKSVTVVIAEMRKRVT